ncbi:putative MO25-like protein [Hordeum vulgare]|nr:putative MO25-like protein [Hordeum vulgare]
MFDGTSYTMLMQQDPDFNDFMKNVIYEGHSQAFHPNGHGQAFDPNKIQSQDGHGYQEKEDDDHGNSWHEDIYCEDEEKSIDIEDEPLFIDELTQRVNAQKRKKSIHTKSYTKYEDKLICES